jgi:exodeoxyribonuclease-1
MTYALRPEDIEWPLGENGLPSFRLELLTHANGITHEGAHDALSDVRATIAFAKLIKDKKPKLYDFYFKLRNKLEAGRMIHLQEQKIVLHVSGMYPTELGCIAPIIPLLQHPVNSNEIIVYDLRKSPEALLKMSSAEMADNLYCKSTDLPTGTERIGLKGVHLNKVPALAPMNTLTPEKAEQWKIDLKQIQLHREMLLADKNFAVRLLDLYQLNKKSFDKCDAESAIYEGFINKNDRALCNQVLKKRPEQRVEWIPSFDDARLNTIYPRYLARNWPHLINSAQLQKWRSFCEARIIDGEFESTMTLTAYQNRLEELVHEDLSEKKQHIVKQLIQWINR